jgi:hypothetical protein
MRIDQRVREQEEQKADQLKGQVSSLSGEMEFNDGDLLILHKACRQS